MLLYILPPYEKPWLEELQLSNKDVKTFVDTWDFIFRAREKCGENDRSIIRVTSWNFNLVEVSEYFDI